MKRFLSRIPVRAYLTKVQTTAVSLYKRYRALSRRMQIIVGAILVALVVGLGFLITGLFSPKVDALTQLPTVTVAAVSELSGGTSSVGVIGSVRSITEASIIAQSGGTVTSVRTSLGGSIPAGYVLAELENASQRASVLQAEGSYDAAIAARSGTAPGDINTSARNTYTSSFNSLDSTLNTYVDTFYGAPGAQGPLFLIAPNPFDLSYFPNKRVELKSSMDAWRAHLATSGTSDPLTLLTEAEVVTRQANALITDIATAATRYNTDASASQLTALASARSSVASIQSGITTAKQTYQSQGTSASAGANASVKIALGALRAAQAQLEKTLIRAPIGGSVNFLPIRVGDYVTPLQHVATVAQNGALEIVTFVSEDNRTLLAVGSKVKIEDKHDATITSISPALDPVTKQVEVHMAVSSGSGLVNGQSVRVALPTTGIAPTTPGASGPTLLPLTALKLTPSARVVFSIGENGRLVSHAVEIGDVRGNKIEIRSELPGDLRIVTDARGLSDGQKVQVATTP
ncbi:MAG: HlyD family efflux transporter periplasmic adaptor subunit [Patescibacteria group bacterium]